MSSTKGSGAARPSPKGRGPQGKKNAAKSHGRKAADKKKVKKPAPSGRSQPVGAAASDTKRPAIVVCSNSSHPECEPGTFDAAALLKSVLAVVEPRLEEGFRSLQQSLSVSGDTAAGEPASQGQDLRALGRQIAEALRAGVIEGMRTRERHLAQLVLIDRAAAQAKVLLRLQERIGAEIEKAGLRRVVDLEDLTLFNSADGASAGPAEGAGADVFELVSPAYVDADSGRVIERGWVRQAPSPGGALPQGKAHGRTSRQHKEKGDESGSELHQTDSGAEGFPRVADSRNVSEAPVAVQQPPEAEESSAGVTANTVSAEDHGCSDSREESGPRGDGHRPDAGSLTPAHPDGGKEVEPCRTGRNAPLIPASFFIRRLLGDPAEEGESQRRNS
ncbi:hypothetical protein [Streptomyces iakyrus]